MPFKNLFSGSLREIRRGIANFSTVVSVLNSWGQLFKRSLASIKQNRVLSHFLFAQRFYLNTIYCEQFCESIQSRQEKYLSS